MDNVFRFQGHNAVAVIWLCMKLVVFDEWTFPVNHLRRSQEKVKLSSHSQLIPDNKFKSKGSFDHLAATWAEQKRGGVDNDMFQGSKFN